MFQKLKKLRLPFLSKKVVGLSFDEIMVAALEEAKSYPLILDNAELDKLFQNKFVTEKGTQVPPKEFVAKIIAHIENNPPQTAEQFAMFVHKVLADIPAPVVAKRKWWQRR